MSVVVSRSLLCRSFIALSLAVVGGATSHAQEIVISGNNVAVSEFQTTMFADGSNLQNLEVGQSRSSKFKVSNIAATGDLVITSATTGGPNPDEFSVTTSTTTIAPGASADLTVTFTPSSLGQKLASIIVNSNATNDNSVSFTVIGQCVDSAPPATQLKVNWGKKAPTISYNKRFGVHFFKGQVEVINEGPAVADNVGVFVFGTKQPGFITFGDIETTELLAYWPIKSIKGVSSKGKPGVRKSKGNIPMATTNDPSEYPYLTAVVMDFKFGELDPSDNNTPILLGDF